MDTNIRCKFALLISFTCKQLFENRKKDFGQNHLDYTFLMRKSNQNARRFDSKNMCRNDGHVYCIMNNIYVNGSKL